MMPDAPILTPELSPRVLVVEDEELIRWAIGVSLKAEGYVVVEAGTIGEARALMEGPLAAAILDYRLPDETGLDLIPDLRRAHPETPIVMMTAYRTNNLADLAEAAGIAVVMDKPFVVEKLIDVVKGLVAG